MLAQESCHSRKHDWRRADKNGPQGNGINIPTNLHELPTAPPIAVRTAQDGANGINVADEKAHTLMVRMG